MDNYFAVIFRKSLSSNILRIKIIRNTCESLNKNINKRFCYYEIFSDWNTYELYSFIEVQQNLNQQFMKAIEKLNQYSELESVIVIKKNCICIIMFKFPKSKSMKNIDFSEYASSQICSNTYLSIDTNISELKSHEVKETLIRMTSKEIEENSVCRDTDIYSISLHINRILSRYSMDYISNISCASQNCLYNIIKLYLSAHRHIAFLNFNFS